MDLIISATIGATIGTARLGDDTFRCALGRAGIVAAKIEGDGATPVGRVPLRYVMFRKDRVTAPKTDLPQRAILAGDGWCDDQTDQQYNRFVKLPYPGRHEDLWRRDHIYDLIVVIGHNDAPIEPDRGSAVFLHVARDDFSPTDGCVAFARADLEHILQHVGLSTFVTINHAAA